MGDASLAPAVVSASPSACVGCAAERVFISTSAAEEAGRFSFEGGGAESPCEVVAMVARGQ